MATTGKAPPRRDRCTSSVLQRPAEPRRVTRRWPWSGRRAPGRRPSCARSPASSGRRRAGSAPAAPCGSTAQPGHLARPGPAMVGLVFQDYALFPHLSVRENVEYAAATRPTNTSTASRSDTSNAPGPGALRRGAPARRARARARPRPGGAAARRAALGARRPHEGRRPHGAAAAAVRSRHPRPARDPRLRGRRGARGPRRRDRRRRASSDGTPGELVADRATRSSPRSRARTSSTVTASAPPGSPVSASLDGTVITTADDGPRRCRARRLPVGHHRLDERAERFRDEPDHRPIEKSPSSATASASRSAPSARRSPPTRCTASACELGPPAFASFKATGTRIVANGNPNEEETR